jgi:hypothetical protein
LCALHFPEIDDDVSDEDAFQMMRTLAKEKSDAEARQASAELESKRRRSSPLPSRPARVYEEIETMERKKPTTQQQLQQPRVYETVQSSPQPPARHNRVYEMVDPSPARSSRQDLQEQREEVIAPRVSNAAPARARTAEPAAQDRLNNEVDFIEQLRSPENARHRTYIDQLRPPRVCDDISSVSSRRSLEDDEISVATDPGDPESVSQSIDKTARMELKVPHQRLHLTLLIFGKLPQDEFIARWRERFRRHLRTDRDQREVDRLLASFASSFEIVKTAAKSRNPSAIYAAMKLHGQQLQEAMRLELRMKNSAGYIMDAVEGLFEKAFESKRKYCFNYEATLDRAARTTEPRYGHSQSFRGRGRGRGRGYQNGMNGMRGASFQQQPFRGS